MGERALPRVGQDGPAPGVRGGRHRGSLGGLQGTDNPGVLLAMIEVEGAPWS